MKFLSVLVGYLFVITSSHAAFKMASYNIRNFDSKKSPTNKIELKKIINSLNADFITVEEIVNTSSFKKFVKNSLPGYQIALSRCGGGGKQKIGFLFKKSVVKLINIYEDNRLSDPTNVMSDLGCGRLRPALVGVFSHVKTKKKFVVVGLHLKAGGNNSSFSKRWRQYEIVSDLVDELKQRNHKNIILMGDMNTTGYSVMNEDYNKFQDLLVDLDMETSGEEMLCTSYWGGTDRHDNIEEASILDHIIYPDNFLGFRGTNVKVHSHCLAQKCSNTSAASLGVSYSSVSDHCPISVNFTQK
jgi:endonuclease/exonuclease/phosphatase family metal-dependent hydrolase